MAQPRTSQQIPANLAVCGDFDFDDFRAISLNYPNIAVGRAERLAFGSSGGAGLESTGGCGTHWDLGFGVDWIGGGAGIAGITGIAGEM